MSANPIRLAKSALRAVRDEFKSDVRPEKDSRNYYESGPYCQIPNLSYILEEVFGQTDTGIFVEIGAYDGITYSNTYGLAVRGWHGLYIEPDPEMASKCAGNYKNFPNITTLDTAIGEPGLHEAPLYRHGPLATINPSVDEGYRSTEWAKTSLTNETLIVPVRTLDDVLSECRFERLDLLVVDTEGYETEVFQGFDIERWRPAMMIVELADTHKDFSHLNSKDRRLYLNLIQRGYVALYKDAVNTILVAQEMLKNLQI